LTVCTVLGCLFATAGPLRAGVYRTDEQVNPEVFKNVKAFKDALDGLRVLAIERNDPTSRRARLLAQAAELEAKGELTVNDRINLSALYIRLSNPQTPRLEDAIRVLGPALESDPANFMVLANLATAYFLSGQLDRAIHYQNQVLEKWPSLWPGQSAEELRHYCRTEVHLLTLMESRRDEQKRPGRPALGVDAIFPGVTFSGPDGDYLVGDLFPQQLALLPPDGGAIVTQLVLWLPWDDRLYWLLGELQNAKGDFRTAATMFHELSFGRNFTASRAFIAHRRELVAAVDLASRLTSDVRDQLLWAMAPRGGVLPAGVGPLAYEGALQAPLYWQQHPPTPLPPEDEAAVPPRPWLPDWRHLAVGFVAGAVVAWLVGHQVRELRRRRQAVAEAQHHG
jgi:hypothetical protein